MMILSFDDNEEDMLQRVISYVNIGAKSFIVAELPKDVLNFGCLEIDSAKRVVIKNHAEIALTYRELEILLLLAKNAGIVFSKEQIYDIVWQEPYYGDYNIVMSHIRHIRAKIEDNPGKPLYIQTVWGVGYRFNKNLSSSL